MIRRSQVSPFFLAVMLLLSIPNSIAGLLEVFPRDLPPAFTSSDITDKIHVDPKTIAAASTDFGLLTEQVPLAVFCPSSDKDIVDLLRAACESTERVTVAARGHGHSVWGQASAEGGVVIDMRCLGGKSNGGEAARIRVFKDEVYVDAGGEQFWIDVLLETLKFGLAPKSWTDYLYLTVGGTLSNAGLSGQSFRHGPQISNVYELDVITGRGERMTCSKELNSDLFFAVLGGLGQFGVITRARIALEPAPERVKWVRLIYTDFATFAEDQEFLISLEGKKIVKRGEEKIMGFDYVEGSVFFGNFPVSNWRSSFFSEDDSRKIAELAAKHGVVYCLEASMNYLSSSAEKIGRDVEVLLEDLRFAPGFVFAADVSYVEFLNRVRKGEVQLKKQNLWDVPHPWLNLFVPKSRIIDFDAGVIKGILLRNISSSGPVLVYPLNRHKWDDRMSAVVPKEEIFFTFGLLRSGTTEDWRQLELQNEEILRFCEKEGIEAKQYLAHFKGKSEWLNHFGRKWETFLKRKARYDPKAILSPGQGIFDSPLD